MHCGKNWELALLHLCQKWIKSVTETVWISNKGAHDPGGRIPVASFPIQMRNTWSFPRLKIHPFLRGFKYICSNFYPLFYMKTGINLKLPVKNNPLWHFKYTFTKITPFFIHSRTLKNIIIKMNPFKKKSHTFVFVNILSKCTLFSWNWERSCVHIGLWKWCHQGKNFIKFSHGGF